MQWLGVAVALLACSLLLVAGKLLRSGCQLKLGFALEPDGVLLANLILDGKLETPCARNLLVTINSVFGRCAVDVLQQRRKACRFYRTWSNTLFEISMLKPRHHNP